MLKCEAYFKGPDKYIFWYQEYNFQRSKNHALDF